MAVVRREAVTRWIAGYERAWRAPGTEQLAELFTSDVTYSMSPWREPIRGLEELGKFWEAERESPEETFGFSNEIVAIERDTAVVRVEVDYPAKCQWRDLWVLRFNAGGRCAEFEEWPFTPGQDDGHS